VLLWPLSASAQLAPTGGHYAGPSGPAGGSGYSTSVPLSLPGHGPTDQWTFAYSERRGTRSVTDQTGAFVQDVDYLPYGEVKDTAGAQPGTMNYTSEQWNGGNALAALGVTQLGARLYDPTIGHFLSRDPVFDPGNLNAYAFAGNDPVNHADPSGSCWTCWFTDIFASLGGGGGSSGAYSSGTGGGSDFSSGSAAGGGDSLSYGP
jgi:RHS repeat-associated protein